LFIIEKGVLDVNDPSVNDYFSPDKVRVPFRNMVYIGDSDTDIPCMKLVNSYGGHSVGVFSTESNDKEKVYKMMRDNRIKYFVPADYSEDSDLDKLLKAIIDRTATNEILEKEHSICANEVDTYDKSKDEKYRKKMSAIYALEGSGSFARTHEIIGILSEFFDYSADEREILFNIALNNSQVYSILSDEDIKLFFGRIISNSNGCNALKIKAEIEGTL